MTTSNISRPKVLLCGDCLHACDIVGVDYKDKRSWYARRIYEYQQQQGHKAPYVDITHVLMVTAGNAQIGYEMTAPHGRYVDIRKDYKGMTLHVFRHPFTDHELRYKIVGRMAYMCNANYGYDKIVAGFIFRKVNNLPGEFCSSAIVDAYRPDVDLWHGKPSDIITPADCCAGVLQYVGEYNV